MKWKIFTSMAVALLALAVLASPAYAGAADAIERGDYYAAHNYLGAAVLAYSVAIETGDRNERILARFQRARVYVAQKRWRAAASDFSEVVAYESDWRKAQSGLAWSFHQQGKNERALAHALAAVQLAPSDYYAWDTLGRILLELDNFPDAISAFREALQEDPKHQKSFWYLMENHGFPLYNFDRA